MNLHIVLIGLPGSGKSTVGPFLARELGLRFLDVDVVISERVGGSVADTFQTMGEAAFREMETEIVDAVLTSGDRTVLAPGGGWAVTGDNLRHAQERAFVVYLETSVEVALARVQGAARPVLEPDPTTRMAELIRSREPVYRSAALIRNTDNVSPEKIAGEIATLARKSGAW